MITIGWQPGQSVCDGPISQKKKPGLGLLAYNHDQRQELRFNSGGLTSVWALNQTLAAPPFHISMEANAGMEADLPWSIPAHKNYPPASQTACLNS